MADIRGDNGNNTLSGTNGDDRIRGEGGNDRLLGRGGNDRLEGGDGNDSILGGAGNDRIRGEHGDDVLAGGTGNDRFVFTLQGGSDIVTDYTDGQDKLDVTDFNVTFDDVLGASTQVGNDVVILLPTGVSITLQHTALSALDAGDFLL